MSGLFVEPLRQENARTCCVPGREGIQGKQILGDNGVCNVFAGHSLPGARSIQLLTADLIAANRAEIQQTLRKAGLSLKGLKAAGRSSLFQPLHGLEVVVLNKLAGRDACLRQQRGAGCLSIALALPQQYG